MAHFRTPTWLPWVGFTASAHLVLPLSGRPLQQYALVVLGIVLFGITLAVNRALGIRGTNITDVEKLEAEP